MIPGAPFRGSLFAEDFLRESIAGIRDWEIIDDTALAGLEAGLRDVFERFPTDGTPNESQTEDDLIWPVLACLGWTAILRQQNLSARGREDVPDGLLFPGDAAKEHANRLADDWRRYEHGLTVVESKRWQRPLDRRSGRRGEETAPSTQMLRYLRRVDDLTTGKLRWGVLTNGAHWRLYYAGARSVSEQFFEIDLAAVLDIAGHNDGQFALSVDTRRHWLRVFALVFRRDAFLPDAVDARTFHQRAIAEGRFYQERVATSLSALVFERVFPDLARAIADAAPDAPLPEVRDAALVLFYRLLFVLYAEDRDLLPVRDTRYDDYALREKVRGDVGRRKDAGDVFSETAARYWSAIDDLCRAINTGDASIGLPPYNGGLFDRRRTPLLDRIRLGDAVMAEVIDALSFERAPQGRRYINYRDLGVQQLGSIYERLLEQEIVRDGSEILVRPNIYARKNSGSYYTPDDLVGLIIAETLEPLVQMRMDAFAAEASALAESSLPEDRRIGRLRRLDPAERLLELKICDPAMGSGHFLVNLVDHLADRVIAAMAEAEAVWNGYLSPLAERIDTIRNTILANAEDRDWSVDPAQLDDRHIIRRMVLKRCVYGVDKNPMAVELAKVSLWLHTFTVGAPLSFLDHHLRCGNSLFGAWVLEAVERVERQAGLFLTGPLTRATRSASSMQIIEGLTDAEIAEAHRSADVFAEVSEMTAPLSTFLSLLHAFDWMQVRDSIGQDALFGWLEGNYGDPIEIALGDVPVAVDSPEAERFAELLEEARRLMADERFLHWQVAFPGVWSEWEAKELKGGFDAIIGNPPWEQMRLEQVEWFAARRPDIARIPRKSERRERINLLKKTRDPLWEDYDRASKRAEVANRIVRSGNDYPLLSGQTNLYSLFVERAITLTKRDGMVGMVVPSGLASDKYKARLFRSVATTGCLKALYDFENRRTRLQLPPFFPDVDSRFKFCIFVASRSPLPTDTQCAFFLQDVSEVEDPDKRFALNAADFTRVNPNFGTAPVFRSRRDADLTTAIYRRLPVLVNRTSDRPIKVWPVTYRRMFDMSEDSKLFRTRQELEEQEGAWPLGYNRFDSPEGMWVPLYQGMMVQSYDHRAASVRMNLNNLHRPGQPEAASVAQSEDPTWLPDPQYWILRNLIAPNYDREYYLTYKRICSPTNYRTVIAALGPLAGYETNANNLIFSKSSTAMDHALCLANLNSIIFDYIARQKIQGQTLNLYILEQLPFVPSKRFIEIRFGSKSAAEIVREAVLELTYTSHDMAPFARDLNHVSSGGCVLGPFAWGIISESYTMLDSIT